MSDLPHRLAEGHHPVTVRPAGEQPLSELAHAIERGHVHVKFTGTRGGTELGIQLDRNRTDLGRADFEKGHGRVRLVGNVTLDSVRVRCIADIDLATLDGTGHLEILDEGAPVTEGGPTAD
jgi:hypothetical protein